MTPNDEDEPPDLRVKGRIPAAKLIYGEPEACFTVMEMTNLDDTAGIPCAVGFYECLLKFTVQDCDPNTGAVEDDEPSYEDDYGLEGVEIKMSDYMRKVPISNFKSLWTELGEDGEILTELCVETNTIAEAVANLTNFLGMQSCDRSDRVDKSAVSHTLFLSGVYCGNIRVLCSAKFLLSDDGVSIKVLFRSDREELSQILVDSLE